MDWSRVTVCDLLGSRFSVYSDVIRGHVLATFGLLLLISNFERPGVACPSLPVRTEMDARYAGCSSVCSKPNGPSEGELSGTDTKLSETGTTTQSAGLDHTTKPPGGQVSTKPPAVTREGLGVREKQGTCPSVDIPKLGLCEDQCQVDSQCSGNMKCCRNGCGKMACTTPKF